MKRAIACALMGVAVLGCSAAESSPGGEGLLYLRDVSQEHCFKTGAARVPEVCGAFQVRWKLASLMGEPIGNYVVAWKLGSVRLKTFKGAATRLYAAGQLPPSLLKAAKASELYIDAIAFATAPQAVGLGTVGLAFNTGVAVRPDGDVSFNVPSGYDWDKFLISRPAASAGVSGWCREKGREHASRADAKRIMIAGVKLRELTLCPGTSMDASPLEAAVDKLCNGPNGAAPHDFCEPAKSKHEAKDVDKPENSPVADIFERSAARNGGASARDASIGALLDEKADRPLVQRKQAEHREKLRAGAHQACEATMAPIRACIERMSCAAPGGPSDRECAGLPKRPAVLLVKGRPSGNCKGSCYVFDRLDDDDARAWDKQHEQTANACKSNAPQREAFTGCQAKAASQCNASQTTQQSCVEAALARSATQAHAEEALRRDRAQAQSLSGSGQRQNFLD